MLRKVIRCCHTGINRGGTPFAGITLTRFCGYNLRSGTELGEVPFVRLRAEHPGNTENESLY
jgi:hypothetical protein